MKVAYSGKRSKISPTQADDIRLKYRTGDYTHKELSEEYGVTPQTIGQICRGMIHRSTLTDSEGWPVNDQGEQIRVLKIKNDTLSKKVAVMELQIYILRKQLGFPVPENPPEIPRAFQRYVNGLDMLDPKVIEFFESQEGQEVLVAAEEYCDD